jgi:hypothetical protein
VLWVKVLAVTFIMALLFSTLAGSVLLVTAQAESSIPKPSVPEFTVEQKDNNTIEIRIRN